MCDIDKMLTMYRLIEYINKHEGVSAWTDEGTNAIY
jgi:hypothetical protein